MKNGTRTRARPRRFENARRRVHTPLGELIIYRARFCQRCAGAPGSARIRASIMHPRECAQTRTRVHEYRQQIHRVTRARVVYQLYIAHGFC